jgi:antiphage defense system Thoeris ThsB-like protein
MGKKIFVSYKHSDSSVYPLNRGLIRTTVRDYINVLEARLGANNIYKGEHDGEDLSYFKDSTIQSHLRDKIYDSSITLVIISPNMKEVFTPESDQWIPWEIAYSLKEHSRDGRASRTNAMLAIVLPDQSNSYNYYLEHKSCCSSGCIIHKRSRLFQILSKNMFNIKNPSFEDCQQGKTIYKGEASYIPSIKWVEFLKNIEGYLDRIMNINENIDHYTIIKEVN